MRKAISVVVVLLGAMAFAPAPARSTVPSDQDTLVTAAQLKAILDAAPASKDTGKPGEVSTQLFGGVASCSFIRLNDPDQPHVHPVSEIYVMQQGSGTLETGGTMIGPFTGGGVHHPNGQPPQATADAVGPDHAGTAIEGGKSQEVKAGDVIMVPAGVNHHWTKIKQPLVYLDIKFPKSQ